jgi:hypothetical protein
MVSLTAVRSSVRGAIMFACCYPPEGVQNHGVLMILFGGMPFKKGSQFMRCIQVRSEAIYHQE